MEDRKQSKSMSDSNKSTGRLAAGISSCTATHISSISYSDITTSIAHEYDELIKIKEEIIDDQERHQGEEYSLLSENNQLDERYLSSGNKSVPKTSIVYENDETLDIKEEIIQEQPNSMSDSEKSTGRLDAGTSSCIATHSSSSNYSGAKISIVYEYDGPVEIKREIIEDQETHQGAEYNHLSKKGELDKKSISSGIKSAIKTAIVYEYDETLEIKEEIVQDPKAVTGQKLNPKYPSTWNTVDTRKADTLADTKPRSHKKKKIQESKPEPEKKYKCQKCARNYKHLNTLNTHQKFECQVTPQFICKLCDKSFKWKGEMSLHVGQVHQKINSSKKKQKIEESEQEPEKHRSMYKHQKTNSNISQARHNCDKCFHSYCSLNSLKRHNRLKHARVKPEFTCDVCGYKTDMKSALSSHISSRHFKNSETSKERHHCDKCSLNYSSLCSLKRHTRSKHSTVKSQFTCDFCGYITDVKYNLSKHISSRHFKKTSEARYNCDKCFQSYKTLSGLHYHNFTKHAAVKRQFICDVCCYKTNKKSTLLSHVSARHFKTPKTPEARHNCDKCSLNYSSLGALKRHNRFKHSRVKPEFTCDVCRYKTNLKSTLSNHISSRHLRKVIDSRNLNSYTISYIR